MGLKMRRNSAPPPPQGCPMTECMRLLGGAWTPNLVWQLSGGARRFSELRRDIAAISPRMLTARLRTLEEKGVVSRTVVPSSPPSVEYALTELGRELIPVIDSIVRVGTRLHRAAAREQRRAAA
ncbi:MAG: helix-turn-helix transcriptional regulator [Gammaproteobacteria bacterium]|nr:helix-turn-helix transcriptional regulator [Gammaproteobacteria bacterium]MBV9620945.1 helix-turn-helix transcriptional regulator [Gammaproteobacteria bacterium]